MRRTLALLLALGVGLASGRLLDCVMSTAEAGGDRGEGGAVSGNGDVNGDGSINVSDGVYLLNWLFSGGPAPKPCPGSGAAPSGLPDTGQTTCYDHNGNVTDCTNEVCAGQDAHYSTGCPSEDRFVDNEDGTVTDTCTGLMWQQDTADVDGDGIRGDGDRIEWCPALAYCENLGFAGYDDWRVPNIRELQSIVDYGRVHPTIDPAFGVLFGRAEWRYWSSTVNPVEPFGSWYVSFDDGGLGRGARRCIVRAVRTVQPGE